MQNKKKKSNDEIIVQDMNLAKTTKSRVKHLIIKILEKQPLLTEKELIFRLLVEDENIKAYVKQNQDRAITYFRFIIWEMAKKGELLKIKVIGDMRSTRYILPSQIDLVRDKITRAPKKIEKLLEQTRAQTKARASEEEEEEEWDEDDIDEWAEEE